MPLYVYRRPDGSTFEVRQPIAEDALTHDPESGEAIERVLFAPAVKFRGSGFYSTDVGTARGNRELERSAEAGADAHDEKMRSQRREREREKAAAAKARTERREAAKVRGEAPAPKRPPVG